MKQEHPEARRAPLRARGGLFGRLWLKIRWVLSRLGGRKAKKNPNVYPLH